MEKITSSIELKKKIALLEQKYAEDERLVKEELLSIANDLKPVNIIKSTFLDLSKSPGMKDSLMNTTLGLATGYASKKLMLGDTRNNLLKEALGMILQVGITTAISNNSERIKSGLSFISNLFLPKKEVGH